MLLKTCALVALIAFAQVVRAQDSGEDMEEAKGKQDDGDDLDSRGGWNNNEEWGGRGRGREEVYLSRHRGSRRSAFREAAKNNLILKGDGLGGNGRGFGGNNLEGAEVTIANQVVTNKEVPGIVEVAPTVVTQSNSAQVFASTRRRNLQQNSNSRVVQNNVVKSTDIHIHTNRKVYQPKTINTVTRRHHTKYVINTQPVKTNINIEREQNIIKPEVQNVVVYQNTESLERHRRPTIVRHKEERQRLPTIRENTQNLGTEVIGNPLNAGSASLSSGGRNFNRVNGREIEGGRYRNHGNRYHGKRGGYGLEYRSNEKQEDEEEAH